MLTEILRTKYPLRRAKIVKKTIQTLLLCIPALIIPLLIGLLVILNSELQLTALVILFVLLITAVLVYWYQTIYFRNYFYDLTEEGLVVGKGVFSTKKTIVPLNKIQDIYLDQDLLDRAFGLWDLHISSATDISGFEAHIDGVSEVDGRSMNDLLLGKTVSGLHETAEVYKPADLGVLLMITASLGFLVLGLFVPILLPIFLILFLLSIPLCILEFKVIKYELRDNGVFIKKGFILPKESLFLYRNIQDVEESYDIVSMILGLRTLTMKTMTRLSAKDARMPYLSPTDSKHIREEILRRCGTAMKKVLEEEDVSETSREEEIQIQKPEDIEKSPFKNHFLKSFLYNTILGPPAVLIIIFIALLTMGLLVDPMFFPFAFFAILTCPFLFFGTGINILILIVSYVYEISPGFITIKKGIFNIRRRQIDYRKMQDIVLNISFPQSFAGLASLKFETGSKEMLKDKSQTITSSSTIVESIPDLNLKDAQTLKKRVAGYMNLSLLGIGKDPLVNKLPLEAIKPVKKTLWWIIYLVPVLVIVLLLPLGGMELLKILFILFCIILLAFKYVYEYYYYKRYFYDMNNSVLVIRKGVFGSREITIPYSKIQDIFIDQDVLDRILGLRDVYVSTVTNRSILNAHIDGVNVINAEKIALLLIEGVKSR